MTVGPAGEVVVADKNNYLIRSVAGGAVSSAAGSTVGILDGAAQSARFNEPMSVAVDTQGTIFVADYGNHRIRMVAGGVVSTLAGTGPGYLDGPAEKARFSYPTDLALDSAGRLFIADRGNHRIRMITR